MPLGRGTGFLPGPVGPQLAGIGAVDTLAAHMRLPGDGCPADYTGGGLRLCGGFGFVNITSLYQTSNETW